MMASRPGVLLIFYSFRPGAGLFWDPEGSEEFLAVTLVGILHGDSMRPLTRCRQAFSKRIRFAIEDLLDLRKAKWQKNLCCN